MGILGIENRTENWKTVQHFHGLPNKAKVCLVQNLGGPAEILAEEISLELFWKGVRDYADKPGPEQMAEIYNRRFSDLRRKVIDFRATNPAHKFQPLKDHNYGATGENQDALCRNLQNTEIDIVLETPSHLFIGEAKHESKFGGEGKLILVHQLIRQYVTATILLDLIGKAKQIVPFVVADGDKLASVKNTVQVKFMLSQGWLKEANILPWDAIEKMVKNPNP